MPEDVNPDHLPDATKMVLKNCPFCGEEAETFFPDPDDFSCVVECSDCGTSGMLYEDEKSAIAAWNRRTPEPARECVLRVSVGDADMPAYGAYKSPSARAGEAQILLNFPLIYATAARFDDKPERIMAETVVHELLHALEDIFRRTFSEHDVEVLVAAAQGIELAEGTASDTEGEALTASYMYGFEEGKKAVLSEPGTSVIHWTRYDGSPETLPLWNTQLLLVGIDSVCIGYYSRKADSQSWVSDEGDLQDVEIGDLWAYLPSPPEGMG